MLWSQFKNGDRNAFARIYELYITDLISYGTKLCSRQETLKDTIQDLFVELWHSRENLTEPDSIQFYLLKSLRYKLIRSEKQLYQQNSIAIVNNNYSADELQEPVESAIIERETSDSKTRVLQKAINSLSKRQQEVIQLRFYQGLTNEQIAELMHMNYQSVSNLIYSSLVRIKKNLRTPVFASSLTAALFLFF